MLHVADACRAGALWHPSETSLAEQSNYHPPGRQQVLVTKRQKGLEKALISLFAALILVFSKHHSKTQQHQDSSSRSWRHNTDTSVN